MSIANCSPSWMNMEFWEGSSLGLTLHSTEMTISRLEQWVGVTGSALRWFSLTEVSVSGLTVLPLPLLPSPGGTTTLCSWTYLLVPLGTIFQRHNISFHCYAVNFQVYFPLKHWCILCPASPWLHHWHQEITLNRLKFNENKTEVMLFIPSCTSSPPCIDRSFLAPYEKSIITNLAVKMDPSLQFHPHVSPVGKLCFFQLKQLSKFKPPLSKHNIETLLNVSFTFWSMFVFYIWCCCQPCCCF